MRAGAHGDRIVVAFGDGTIVWYRDGAIERFWRPRDPGRETAFGIGVGAGPEVVDVAGPYRLRADGRIEGLPPLPFGARFLTSAPAARLAVARDRFEDLDRSVVFQVEATDAGCAPVAVDGGYVVAVPWGGDLGALLLLGPAGGIRKRRQLPTPIRGIVALPDGRLLAVGEGERARVGWIDPQTLAFEPRGRSFDWDATCAAAAVADGAVFASFTWAVRVRVDGDGLHIEALPKPTGDPSTVFGPTRWADARLCVRGSPGPFEVEATAPNVGERNDTGLIVVVEVSGPVRVTRVALGAQSAEIRDGRGSLPARLAHGADVTVRIAGAAAGPGSARVQLIAERLPDPLHRLAKTEHVACTLDVDAQVDPGLVAARGDHRIAVDPDWVGALHRAGALDVTTAAPDLDRWRHRAASRLRSGPDDPAVWALFLELSAADRARSGAEGRVAGWKFAGGDWTIGAAEAAVIARALGEAHPFGRFAAAGTFTVTSARE